MRHRSSPNLPVGLLVSCLLVLAVPAAVSQEEDTVEEIRERIREQEKEAEAEAEQEEEEEEEEEEVEENEEEDESSGCQLFSDLLQLLLEALWKTSADDGQALPRPFSPWFRGAPPAYSPWGYLELELGGSYLGRSRWSAAGRVTLNVQAVHLHAFSQFLFDPTGLLACYAVNAGLNFSARRLILNLFAGAFGTDLTTRALLGFGGEARIFLSASCFLDLYNLNAMYHSLQFHFLSLALQFARPHVSLGAGFDLNYYAGIWLPGPSVRLAFRI